LDGPATLAGAELLEKRHFAMLTIPMLLKIAPPDDGPPLPPLDGAVDGAEATNVPTFPNTACRIGSESWSMYW